MKNDVSTVRSSKVLMFVGYMGIIVPGLILFTLALPNNEFLLVGLAGWACGSGGPIYLAGRRVISSLEKQLASFRAGPEAAKT